MGHETEEGSAFQFSCHTEAGISAGIQLYPTNPFTCLGMATKKILTIFIQQKKPI